MREATFPKPVAEVVATLADIFRHQGRMELVELLESAHARFDEVNYDNWNGGTYTWALRLEVPVGIFASVEPRLSDIEKDITGMLAYFSRLYPNDHLDEVTVSPIAAGVPAIGQRMAPSEIEVNRLWHDGRFRLFLCHVSKHKVLVSNLKDELVLRGVDAFVAHEDIEPTLEWQREIELALRSMYALAALITTDFHPSFWTDQEVGWAFGRGILVLPVRLGADPYGFAGKVQGVSGTLEQPAVLAASIVDALLVNPQTHGEMRRALISAFCGATSFSMALVLYHHVVRVVDFTEEEKEALRKACTENSQVAGAYGVADAIYKIFGGPPTAKKTEVDDVPF
jgi:hypothetical protein